MKAVSLIRASSAEQVDGHSLDAQERQFQECCISRGFDAVGIYREEGKSAHTDSISKRPVLRQFLEDAALGKFDVVVVHTLDRWARNLKVLLETVAILNQYGVGLVSITENLDWSTPKEGWWPGPWAASASSTATFWVPTSRRGSARGLSKGGTWERYHLDTDHAGRTSNWFVNRNTPVEYTSSGENPKQFGNGTGATHRA